MSTQKKVIGLTIAAAVATAFALTPVTSTFAADAHQVKCRGLNACKGKSACAVKHKNKCKTMNSCKGQGFVMVDSKKECKKMRHEAHEALEK